MGSKMNGFRMFKSGYVLMKFLLVNFEFVLAKDNKITKHGICEVRGRKESVR